MIKRNVFNVLQKRLRESNPLLQILIGPRQVGKTTTAKQIYDEWEGPKLSVSADSPTPPAASWITLQWQQAKRLGKEALLIIDEVQKIPGWSEQIKILFDPERGQGNLKVLLLGSSSLGLQQGLTESLAGRFELTQATHWTFAECHHFFGWDLETYIRFGAYPGAASFIDDEERWRNYILHSIIEPVLSRDILSLHPVNKPALFRQAFEIAVQYPAHIVSLQKMLGQLQEQGNVSTIKNYLDLLSQAFLLLPLQKYSGSTIRAKGSSPKLVILNQALTHAYISQERIKTDPFWYGFIFESIIGAHLSYLPSSQLFYWREGQDEVDYILKTPRGLMAIEIKAGPRKKGKGILRFAKEYPNAHCEIWDRQQCEDFLQNGEIKSITM